MEHPSLYKIAPFTGLHVMVVDEGTVIRDERSGEEVTITNRECARKGTVIYCTQDVFDELKKQVAELDG